MSEEAPSNLGQEEKTGPNRQAENTAGSTRRTRACLQSLVNLLRKTKKAVSSTRVANVDSTVESEKLKLFQMDDNIKPIKFRLTRRWHFLLGLGISVVAMVISIAALIGALIPLTHVGKHHSSGEAKTTTGATASTGNKAASQPSLTDKQITKLLAELVNLRKEMRESRISPGTAYTHWGRESCNGDAEVVYAGFGASAPTQDPRLTGSGVEYLCMPKEPEWNQYDTNNDSLAYSWIYGGEIRSDAPKIFGDNVHGQSVVCSICMAPRSAQLMIPAKRTCPDRWTKEYEGYLMSSYISNQKSSFICVNEKPEGIVGTGAVGGGALLYHVAGYCGTQGSLHHCPPYEHARELTCVVCTK